MEKGRSTLRKGKRAVGESVYDDPSLRAFSDEPRAGARLAPFLAFLLLLALYLATLCPSVGGGDSGELTAAALTGGVPHPSGYPLFALLARFFAALPLGHSPAWRVNLLSAVPMAAAAGLVCAVVQSWTRNSAAGLLAAALFGTSRLVWSHATTAEVFGLNAMFVALAFLLWLRVECTLSRREVFALLFASGLAMCNHHTFVFVGAPLVVRSLWIARRNLGAGGVVLALMIGLSGLLPNLYLMPASASASAVSWGDETNLAGLCAHILRLNYGTFHMGRTGAQAAFVGSGTFLPTLWHMGGRAFPRLLWFGPLLALTGFYLGIKNRPTRAPVSLLLFILCFYGLTFSALSNVSTSRPHFLGILGRFFIESDLLLAIASGFGLAALSQRLDGRSHRRRLLQAGAGLVFAVGVAVHAGQANGRNNTVLRDFVTTAFASLPRNAIVITSMGDDVTGSAFYLHEVEKLRPDVILFDSDYLAKPWYTARQRHLHPDVYLPEGGYGNPGWNIKQLLDGNPQRPLTFIGHLEDWDQSWKDGYKLAIYGLVRWLVRTSDFPRYEEWAERDRQAIGSYDVAPALRAPEESWEKALGLRVLDIQVTRAHLALVYGYERGDPSEPARTALRLLEDVVAKSGGDEELGIAAWPGMRKIDTSVSLWRNLSLAYQALSRIDDTYTPRFVLACARFVNRADPNDPDLPMARKYLDETRAVQPDKLRDGRRVPIKSY